MSPQFSRIDRVTRAGVAAISEGSPDSAAARAMARDVRLLVDQVVQPLDERLLRADAVVHGLRRDARGLGDVAHARAGVAALGEQPPRRPQDLIARELCLALSKTKT